MKLFFRDTLIGTINPDPSDPPFCSGEFEFTESAEPDFLLARTYLEFTSTEFNIKEGSKAYAAFEKQMETDFAGMQFSEEWYVLTPDNKKMPVEDVVLSPSKTLFWTE